MLGGYIYNNPLPIGEGKKKIKHTTRRRNIKKHTSRRRNIKKNTRKNIQKKLKKNTRKKNKNFNYSRFKRTF